jgi:hypothetical protein
MFKFRYGLVLLAPILFTLGCGINSVTKRQLGAVKPGDVLVYRYQKDGKSWFYADKVTRIEGDTIYYNPSTQEGTAGNDDRIYLFNTSRELSIPRSELMTYDTEQGDGKKVIIWIK